MGALNKVRKILSFGEVVLKIRLEKALKDKKTLYVLLKLSLN